MSILDRFGRKRLAVGSAIFVVVGGSIAVWALALRAAEAPPADADLVTLANFVRSDEFEQLPEAQKRPYMKTLRKNLDELAQAQMAGKISLKDYHKAYLNAYMERKLDHMEEYYSLPADRRMPLLAAKYAKKERESAKAAPATGNAEPPEPDELMEEDFTEDRVETWPPEEQAKWEEFRKAVKQAKEAAKVKR